MAFSWEDAVLASEIFLPVPEGMFKLLLHQDQMILLEREVEVFAPVIFGPREA